MSETPRVTAGILPEIEDQLPPLLKSKKGWKSIAYKSRSMRIERLERVIDGHSVFLDRLTRLNFDDDGPGPEPRFAERVLQGELVIAVCEPWNPDDFARPTIIGEFKLMPGSAYWIQDSANVRFMLVTKEVLTVMVCLDPQLIDPRPMKSAKVASLLAVFRKYYPATPTTTPYQNKYDVRARKNGKNKK